MLKIATIVLAGVLFAAPAMAQTGTGTGGGQPGHANSTEKPSNDKGMMNDKAMKSDTTGMDSAKPSTGTTKETSEKNASPASMDTGIKKDK